MFIEGKLNMPSQVAAPRQERNLKGKKRRTLNNFFNDYVTGSVSVDKIVW